MRLLLTSTGVKNTSIHNALVDLLGKPIAASSALFIPTAVYAFPAGFAPARREEPDLFTDPFCSQSC